MFNARSKTCLISLICLFASIFQSDLLAANPNFGAMVYMKDSLYSSIFVYKSGSVVSLRFGRQNDNSVQSQVDVENLRTHMCDYTELTFSGLVYTPDPNNVLVLGLGGGVIPREMRNYFPKAKIDIIEIDQEIPPIAKKYFKFETDENMKVHISDGRVFVKKQARLNPVPKYDYIVLDAFNSDYIPFHLMTKEFLEELKAILSDDGVIVANVWYPNQLFDAEFKTFLAVFERSQVFCGNGNAIIVTPGAKATLLPYDKVVQKATELQNKLKFTFSLVRVANSLVPNAKPHPQAMILTDDRAPVNQLRNQTR